mmetsp:Transcript_30944/g.76756  ORF Transcript_30944/g.76756 Transcript_30944/m.76756 type:complete len:212 (+) Transcript_30944:258-893(+)
MTHRSVSLFSTTHSVSRSARKSTSGRVRMTTGKAALVDTTRPANVAPLPSSTDTYRHSGVVLNPKSSGQSSESRSCFIPLTEVMVTGNSPAGFSGAGFLKKTPNCTDHLSCKFWPSCGMSLTSLPPFFFMTFSTTSFGPTPEFIKITGLISAPALRKISPPSSLMQARFSSLPPSSPSSLPTSSFSPTPGLVFSPAFARESILSNSPGDAL